MKTKSTIKLFATAILATAAIGTTDVINTSQNVFASEVTQVPNKNNVGTRTTFETDPVFNSFEEGEKYLDDYVKPTIENSRYGYYSASVVPDGLGGNYLVEGFIDSHSEDEEVIKGNKETAQKIVENAGKDLSQSNPTAPVTPSDDEPVEIPAVPVEPSTPTTPSETPTVPTVPTVPATPSETPTVPTVPTVPTTPSETPTVPTTPSETPTVPTVPTVPAAPAVPTVPTVPAAPAVPAVPTVPAAPTTPVTPTVSTAPSAPSVTPAAPAVTPSEQVAPVAPSAPANSNDLVEDNSKPTIVQDQEVKPAQSIVAVSDSDKASNKSSENVKNEETRKTETSAKSVESEPIKKGEDRLKELPNTGEASSSLSIVGLMILSVFAGFFGFKKRNS